MSKGYEEGVYRYIIKPASIEKIVSAIKDVLEENNQNNNHEEYIANVAHELLNPLCAIKEGLLLSSEEFNKNASEKSKHIFNITINEITQLTAFTNEMLKLARLNTSEFPFHPEWFDIKPLLTEIKDAFQFGNRK